MAFGIDLDLPDVLVRLGSNPRALLPRQGTPPTPSAVERAGPNSKLILSILVIPDSMEPCALTGECTSA